MKLKILFTSIIFLQCSTAVYPMDLSVDLPELTDIIDQGYLLDEATQDQDDDFQEREEHLKRLRTEIENILEQQSIPENPSLLPSSFVTPEQLIPQPRRAFKRAHLADKTLHFIRESSPTTRQKLFNCPQPGCDKQFPSIYTLNKHMGGKNCPWPKAVTCSICHHPFSRPAAKDLHMQRVHYKNSHDSDHARNKQSSVDQKQIDKLCFHFRTHKVIQKIALKKTPINPLTKYPCPNLGCEKQCGSPQALANHIKGISCPWVPNQVFTCPECPRRIFKDPYNREAHMKEKHPHGLPNQYMK